MPVIVKNTNTGGPTGEFQRPGGARFEPGSSTHTLIPNRHAQVTVEVGPPMVPIESVHARTQEGYLIGTPAAAGELVLGTDLHAESTANDEWIGRYNQREFGRQTEDLYAGMRVPFWYPTLVNSPVVEDRG